LPIQLKNQKSPQISNEHEFSLFTAKIIYFTAHLLISLFYVNWQYNLFANSTGKTGNQLFK